MILPPIIRGSYSKALPWLGYAKRLGFWFQKQSAKYVHITRRPTKNVVIRIKRYSTYIQPYITALRAVLPAGFITTPRIGIAKVAFGDVSGHNLVNHVEVLEYNPATPYIADSGYQPPYDVETGVGTDFPGEIEFYEAIGGHERVQWFPRYQSNPALRFFSPTIGDQDAFTTFDTRIEASPNADWKGPENIVLSWFPRSGWTIYYNGLASWVAPGFINGVSLKKVETEDETYWELYATVSTLFGPNFGGFIEVWKRRADRRDWLPNEIAVHDEISKILLTDQKLPFNLYVGSYSPAREIAVAKAAGGTEPTLEAVLAKVGDTSPSLMPITGIFSYTASFGDSVADIATAVGASAKSAYDPNRGGRLFMSIGSAVNESTGDTEYVFVYWFSWHGIHDNNAWSLIGTLLYEDDVENYKTQFGETNPSNQLYNFSSFKVPINHSCNEIALCIRERGTDFEYIGNHLLLYSINEDSSISLKEIRLGNYSLIWGIKSFRTDATFQNPQYVDVDYSGNTLRLLTMNTESLPLNQGLNSQGLPGFRGWTAFKYQFPWRISLLDSANSYIEEYDLRHNKLVWTKMDSGGVKTYFDSGNSIDEVIYSSSIPIIETENNNVWYALRISTNTVQLATLPNGITLLSAVLSANPIGVMADHQAQFPIFTWSGVELDADFLMSGYFYTDDFDRPDVNNTVDLFDPWPDFENDYPFAIARPPEVVTVNILTNNENPGEILKLPDVGGGQLDTLLPIGIYGFSDGSDPLNIIPVNI